MGVAAGETGSSGQMPVDPGPEDLSACLSLASFRRPERTSPLPWLAHVPFAFWLIGAARPRRLVDLGGGGGLAFSTFCQAVQSAQLATDCLAVDSWRDDDPAGDRGAEAYDALTEYCAARYSHFARLLRCSFAEGLEHVADGSVDLLHIHGFHNYQAAARDFDAWLPKMSSRGLVLLDDTAIAERDFGVARLWREVSGRFPDHFEFPGGNGLGVLAVGPEMPAALRDFFRLGRDPAGQERIRAVYGCLGDSFLTEQSYLAQIRQAKAANEQVLQQSHVLETRLAQMETQRAQQESLRAQLEIQRAHLESTLAHSEKLLAQLDLRMEQTVAEHRQWAEAAQARELAALAECHRLAAVESHLRGELQGMKDSSSWRLTAPLRGLKARLLPGRRGGRQP